MKVNLTRQSRKSILVALNPFTRFLCKRTCTIFKSTKTFYEKMKIRKKEGLRVINEGQGQTEIFFLVNTKEVLEAEKEKMHVKFVF